MYVCIYIYIHIHIYYYHYHHHYYIIIIIIVIIMFTITASRAVPPLAPGRGHPAVPGLEGGVAGLPSSSNTKHKHKH